MKNYYRMDLDVRSDAAQAGLCTCDRCLAEYMEAASFNEPIAAWRGADDCQEHYFHPGVCSDPRDPDSYVWSGETYDTRIEAERAARGMALDYAGAIPMVQSWQRAHGEQPSSADAVDDCWVVPDCEGVD